MIDFQSCLFEFNGKFQVSFIPPCIQVNLKPSDSSAHKRSAKAQASNMSFYVSTTDTCHLCNEEFINKNETYVQQSFIVTM